jgi:hypothetical protein
LTQFHQVIEGAMKTISSKVKLFAFEGSSKLFRKKFAVKFIKKFDSLGFSCFSTSKAGLIKWAGNCISEEFWKYFNSYDKGNIFCVHRERAPMLALAFEGLSMPLLLASFHSTTPLSSQQHFTDEEWFHGMKAALIQSKWQCSPYPSCLASIISRLSTHA